MSDGDAFIILIVIIGIIGIVIFIAKRRSRQEQAQIFLNRYPNAAAVYSFLDIRLVDGTTPVFMSRKFKGHKRKGFILHQGNILYK